MAMWRDAGIGLVLAMAAAAVFWPVGGYGFVNFDDSSYVYQNPNVRGGLSWDAVAWAFTDTGEANWHPLTRLSHMLDCQLFGLDAGWHHAVSVVLHVESVAWVAERKDVLSTVFWMLAMLAYVRYAGRPSIIRYVPVFVFLAMGLMAKPMLVTLPVVLLLLDYWPLGRLGTIPLFSRISLRLVLEKTPLLALSAASCVVTYWAQQAGGAMKFGRAVPLADRVSNGLVSYVAYLGKAIRPVDLAVFYPYVTDRPIWQPLAAGAILAVVTAAVIRQMRRRPYLAVGWLWYLVTLLPVIGLVQVGKQAMADRFTYVPLIGIFIAATWLAADVLARWGDWGKVLAPAAVGVLAACGIAARQQVQYWENGETLFRRALAVMPDNAVAHGNLGEYLAWGGRYSEAAAHLREAVRLDPADVGSHCNLVIVLIQQGRIEEAASAAENACALTGRRDPACLDALAAAYAEAGRFMEAAAAAREAAVLAEAQGRRDMAEDIAARLKGYESGKPWRQAAPRQQRRDEQ